MAYRGSRNRQPSLPITPQLTASIAGARRRRLCSSTEVEGSMTRSPFNRVDHMVSLDRNAVDGEGRVGELAGSTCLARTKQLQLPFSSRCRHSLRIIIRTENSVSLGEYYQVEGICDRLRSVQMSSTATMMMRPASRTSPSLLASTAFIVQKPRQPHLVDRLPPVGTPTYTFAPTKSTNSTSSSVDAKSNGREEFRSVIHNSAAAAQEAQELERSINSSRCAAKRSSRRRCRCVPTRGEH